MTRPYQDVPCPLCGSHQVRLIYSASGIGGQMITVAPFAECECCLTLFRESAASTAGFSISESKRLWADLPATIQHWKRHNERNPAKAASE